MKARIEQTVDDEDVVIKCSVCSHCKGIVRAIVKHTMTVPMRNEFLKEVMQHNLYVKEVGLIEYREDNRLWCTCQY